MNAFGSITSAGFAATAMTYGPARMGFGLFLNSLREHFGMDAGTAGLISAFGFSGFLLALTAGYVLAARAGPRTPVVIGLALAAAGMGVIAAAQDVVMLAAGAVLAMSSAGFSWAPFNAAADRHLGDTERPDALSIVSTGTSAGIVAAALAALGVAAADLSWRVAWAGFALAGALAMAAAVMLLRGAECGPRAQAGAPRRLVSRRAGPLYLVAFAFGAVSTVYMSFAADRIARAGGIPGAPDAAASGVLFAIFGLAGLAGLITGRVGERLGVSMLLRVLFAVCAASFALIALAPGSLAAVLASAALQGAFVMMISATLAFWSERLFYDLPSMSFTAALLAAACGAVLGPLLAGYSVDAFGFTALFTTLGAASAALALLIPPRMPGAPGD